jgi:hypothetical protein
MERTFLFVVGGFVGLVIGAGIGVFFINRRCTELCREAFYVIPLGALVGAVVGVLLFLAMGERLARRRSARMTEGQGTQR